MGFRHVPELLCGSLAYVVATAIGHFDFPWWIWIPLTIVFWLCLEGYLVLRARRILAELTEERTAWTNRQSGR